jgi:hypothetical protein
MIGRSSEDADNRDGRREREGVVVREERGERVQ